MAGVVDLIKGQPSTTTNAIDNANFILSLAKFFKATENIEKTSSVFLNTEDGPSPILELKHAKNSLKELAMALGNFLSNKLMDYRGLVSSNYNLETHRAPRNQSFEFMVQVKSIQAFLTLAKILDVNLYNSIAVDAYFALNKHFWNEKTGVHTRKSDGDREINLYMASELVKTLHMLNEVIPEESRASLQKLKNGYLRKMTSSLSLDVVNHSDKRHEDRNNVADKAQGWYSFSTAIGSN